MIVGKIGFTQTQVCFEAKGKRKKYKKQNSRKNNLTARESQKYASGGDAFQSTASRDAALASIKPQNANAEVQYMINRAIKTKL